MADRPDRRRHFGMLGGRHRSIDLVQGRALMHRDMIGLVTLDLVLRILRARVMGVTLIVGVFLVHLSDFAAHVARFGIPAHVIAYFELRTHMSNSSYTTIVTVTPQLQPRVFRGAQSNRHAVAEEFMILVVTALTRTQIGIVVHEFYGRDPFDHFESVFVLAP